MDEGIAPGSAFHVTQHGNEDLVWTAVTNGAPVEYDADPGTSLWLRVVIGFVRLLPIDQPLIRAAPGAARGRHLARTSVRADTSSTRQCARSVRNDIVRSPPSVSVSAADSTASGAQPASMASTARCTTRGRSANIASPGRIGHNGRRLLGLLTDDKLRRVLGYMLHEDEFLSPFGIRSRSRYHRDHPYTFLEGWGRANLVYRGSAPATPPRA